MNEEVTSITSLFKKVMWIPPEMSKRSDIWNHVDDIGGDDKARCKFCRAEIGYRGGSTSAFWKHVESKHTHAVQPKLQSVYEEAKKKICAILGQTSTVALTTDCWTSPVPQRVSFVCLLIMCAPLHSQWCRGSLPLIVHLMGGIQGWISKINWISCCKSGD